MSDTICNKAQLIFPYYIERHLNHMEKSFFFSNSNLLLTSIYFRFVTSPPHLYVSRWVHFGAILRFIEELPEPLATTQGSHLWFLRVFPHSNTTAQLTRTFAISNQKRKWKAGGSEVRYGGREVREEGFPSSFPNIYTDTNRADLANKTMSKWEET